MSMIGTTGGGITEDWVSTNYIDNSEMTTISGDIVNQIGEGEVTLEQLTTTSGDLIAQAFLIDGSSEIAGNIIPEMTGASGTVSARNIGSSSQKFNNGYFHDVHVDAGSLYVNTKKVLEDIANTITVSTDSDQDLAIKTTGIGDINLLSEHSVTTSSKGGIELIVPADQTGKDLNVTNSSANGGVYFTAAGSNQNMEMLAFEDIKFTSETVTINADATVTGTLNVVGTITQNSNSIITITELTTASGDIITQIPSLAGYATESWVNNQSFVTLTELTTTSGDIVNQIPSLSGYATESWVSSQSFINLTELTTTSGDIVAQMPSLAGYATESWVSTSYIDNNEMTTISGDLVNQIGNSSGVVHIESLAFTQGTSSPATIFSPDDNITVLKSQIDVTTTATGGSPSISIGHSGDIDSDFETSDCDLTMSGIYEASSLRNVGASPNAIQLTITPAGQTFGGAAYVWWVDLT